MRPSLSEAVPEEIRVLFETARGALVCGYFFYPLYALGVEQFFRVEEAAVGYRCRELDAPTSARRFRDKLEWLISQGLIPEKERPVWEAIRQLRNIASHPERQTLSPPGSALTILIRITEDINALFSASVER